MKKKYLIVIKPAAVLPQAFTVRSVFVLSEQSVTKHKTDVRRNSDFLRKNDDCSISIICCLVEFYSSVLSTSRKYLLNM